MVRDRFGGPTFTRLERTDQYHYMTDGYLTASPDYYMRDGCHDSSYVPPELRHAPWCEGQHFDPDTEKANTPKIWVPKNRVILTSNDGKIEIVKKSRKFIPKSWGEMIDAGVCRKGQNQNAIEYLNELKKKRKNGNHRDYY